MLRRIRIAVQLIVLGAFLYLLLRTIGVGDNRLGHPVRIFLEIDPLIGLTTWLRTGTLHGLMWLSLVTLAMSFVLGRFFCGWICPLGTLSQITLRTGRSRERERSAGHSRKQERSADRSRKQDRSADRYRPRQRVKYLILLFVLGGAAAGTLWTGILDPISLLIRGLALGFGPPVESVVRNGAAALAYTPAGSVTEPLYRFVRDTVMASQQPFFRQGMLLASILVAVLLFSWISRRFWCRSICPLGALVGVAARAGMLKLRQDDEACTACAICAFHCQGAADPDLRGGWRPDECFVCGNCTSSCRKGGLSFGFEMPRIARGAAALLRRGVRRGREGEAPRRDPHDAGRRAFIAAAGLGLISGPLGQMAPARHRPGPELIRPPGAGSEAEFLDRCIRCGECMKVCPTGGLQPAGFEAGLAGLWTPVLHPRIGYCEYHCTLCGQVCPTGAIAQLTDEEKTETVIGLAHFDTGRCLPYAYGTPCIVCEEHCPTSPKAIVLEDVEVLTPGGSLRIVQRPRVDPHACVGCGICEKVCPMEGRSAVRVVAIRRTGEGGPFDLSF